MSARALRLCCTRPERVGLAGQARTGCACSAVRPVSLCPIGTVGHRAVKRWSGWFEEGPFRPSGESQAESPLWAIGPAWHIFLCWRGRRSVRQTIFASVALEQFDAGAQPFDLILQFREPTFDGLPTRRRHLRRLIVLTGQERVQVGAEDAHASLADADAAVERTAGDVDEPDGGEIPVTVLVISTGSSRTSSRSQCSGGSPGRWSGGSTAPRLVLRLIDGRAGKRYVRPDWSNRPFRTAWPRWSDPGRRGRRVVRLRLPHSSPTLVESGYSASGGFP